jgi:heat shock protein HtpX
MYSQIDANKRKTIFLMFGFFVLVGLLAYILGLYFKSYSITIFALVFATGYAFWSYYASDKLALSINNAQPIQKADDARLWRMVENLTIATGLPMPKIYVIDDPAANAFATGRDPKHATITVTTGLLAIMDDNELEGVLAHELGHVQNYDIRVSMIAFGLVAAVALISDMVLRGMFWGGGDDEGDSSPFMIVLVIVALLLAPIAAMLIQLSISRKREYLADATGALTTRYPEGLASALAKIEVQGSSMKKQNPSTAHLFFANPLNGKSFSNLFSTHPPIEDRIKALREMETKA